MGHCSETKLHAILHAVHPDRTGPHFHNHRAGAAAICPKLGAVAGLIGSAGRFAKAAGGLRVRNRRVGIAKGVDRVHAKAGQEGRTRRGGRTCRDHQRHSGGGEAGEQG